MRYLIALGLMLGMPDLAAPQTSVHYDHSVDFSQYTTFRFLPGKTAGKSGRKDINKSQLDKQVKEVVTAALRKDGLKYRGEKSDLTVTYIAGVKDMVQLQDLEITPGMNNEFPNKPGDYPSNDYSTTRGTWETSPDNWWKVPYEQETFILDIYDTKKKKLVWRGYAATDPAKYNQAAFTTLLKNELQQFPPRPAKKK